MLDKFSAEKKKQFIYIVAAVSGLSLTVILLSTVFQGDKPKEVIDAPTINIVNKKDTDEKVFRKEFGSTSATHTAQIDALKKELETMKNNGDSNNTLQNGQVQKNQTMPTNQQLPMSSTTSAMKMLIPPAPVRAEEKSKVAFGEPKEEKHVKPTSIVMNDMIGTVSGSAPVVSPDSSASKKKAKQIEIPSGSFMQGVLLSGIDAPTGGKAKSSPQPVLIKVTNLAHLPNRFKANLKECHIIGSGYGDLSSERAFVRVEKIACMTNDGRAIEKGATGQAFGYVAGEDGKVGLAGRVVSKQGAILARTLAAGFLEGVSKSFSVSTSSVSIQPTGSVTTPNPSDTLQNGLFAGAGEASKKLADFYMKLANEMFPVVEINAGRKVDIVILEKLSFDIEDKDAKK